MTELLYKDITFDIRGACFWVWKEFRGAFKEKVIDRALTIELKKRGRMVEDQKCLDISYEGIKVGAYVPDKIVDGKVLVELKCKEFLTQQDMDQFWKYLKGSEYKLGLLINFGPKGLEIKRVVYDTARAVLDPRSDRRVRSAFGSADKGFTLIEVVVATTIFAVVAAATMALFNYTLKINRRTEALRQASQGIRNFTEYVVKTVRNGQIDFAVKPDQSGPNTQVGPCPAPTALGNDTYSQKENKLGLLSPENERLCLFLGDAGGNAVAGFIGETLVMQKEGGFKQILNPPYFKIENLMFLIRPLKDPYVTTGGLAQTQPFVSVVMKVIAQLPTGETQPIYYQTAVSSDKYDIPNN